MNEIHEISGAIHIHTRYSDGSSDLPQIAAWAAELGLDFLLFSDHHTLQPRLDGLEGFHQGVLTLIGYETSDNLDHNHYLIFETERVTPGLTTPEYVESARLAGGLGIIAHPIEKRDALPDFPPYPWTHWELNGFDGIEMWNQLSEWTEGLTRSNRLNHFLHPLKTLKAPPAELLEKWDELALKRKILGIAGVDAHCFKVRILRFFRAQIFHYKVTFRSLRNHLLLEESFARGNLEKARWQVFSALRGGHLYFSNPRLGEAGGFRFWGETGNRRLSIGEEFSGNEVVFKAGVPLTSEITLLRNGRTVAATVGNSLEFRAQAPGVYRVEVKRKGRAWIFSNHIYWKGLSI